MKINIKDNFYLGICFAIFTFGLIQEYLGKEAYMKVLEEIWSPTLGWWTWLIPMFIVAGYSKLNNTWNEDLVLFAKHKPLDAINQASAALDETGKCFIGLAKELTGRPYKDLTEGELEAVNNLEVLNVIIKDPDNQYNVGKINPAIRKGNS